MALQLQQNLIQILGQDEDKFGSDQAEMAAKSNFFRKEHLRMVAQRDFDKAKQNGDDLADLKSKLD